MYDVESVWLTVKTLFHTHRTRREQNSEKVWIFSMESVTTTSTTGGTVLLSRLLLPLELVLFLWIHTALPLMIEKIGRAHV